MAIISTLPAAGNTSAAAHQVFDTAELLEMILIELPLRNICGVQRTCKTFKATTDGSQKLQVAMFLAPADSDFEIRENPLLRGARFQPDSICPYTDDEDSIYPVEDRARPDFQFAITSDAKEHEVGWMTRGGLHLVTSRQGGQESWRRMQAMQPPQAGMVVTLRIQQPERYGFKMASEVEYHKAFCEPATIGEIFEFLDGEYEQHRKAVVKALLDHIDRGPNDFGVYDEEWVDENDDEEDMEERADEDSDDDESSDEEQAEK